MRKLDTGEIALTETEANELYGYIRYQLDRA